MNKPDGVQSFAAPCIVDEGVLINRDDIERLLTSLCRVNYIHIIEGKVSSEGQGSIEEVFSDLHQSTLIANEKLYINIQSFDYLQLSRSTNNEACFDLIQDHRQLRLLPIGKKNHQYAASKNIDEEAIEAMVTQVLSARIDVQLDDEYFQ